MIRRLPIGYTEVEYLETDGNSYINTNISGANGTNLELEVSFPEVTSSVYCTIIGALQKTDYPIKGYEISATLRSSGNSNRISWQFSSDKSGSQFLANEKINLKVEGTGRYKCYTNDNLDSEDDTYNTSRKLYLFAEHGSSTYSYCPSGTKCYSLHLFNSSGDLGIFVPCIQDSNNEAGMYDLVSNAFFGNDGTGTFTAGPEVILEEVHEYIHAIKDSSDVIQEYIGVKAIEDPNWVELPTNYTLLEYIKNTNYYSGIKAPLTLSDYITNDCVFEYSAKCNSPSIYNQYVFGNSSKLLGVAEDLNNNKLLVKFALAYYTLPIAYDLPEGKSLSDWHTVKVSKSEILYDGIKIGTPPATVVDISENVGSIYLFNTENNASTGYFGEIKYLKITLNNNLIGHLVMTKWNTDNKLYGYEIITNSIISPTVYRSSDMVAGPALKRYNIQNYKSSKLVEVN